MLFVILATLFLYSQFSYLLLQAHEIISGPLVRYSANASGKQPPTALLVHGIMGNRRNMHSFARRLVQVRFIVRNVNRNNCSSVVVGSLVCWLLSYRNVHDAPLGV